MKISFISSQKLKLSYNEWEAYINSIQDMLDPELMEWLKCWKGFDLVHSPMDDKERSLIRLGHYTGWIQCMLPLYKLNSKIPTNFLHPKRKA